jgi:hypothetical protein
VSCSDPTVRAGLYEVLDELSANLTLPDYGRFARYSCRTICTLLGLEVNTVARKRL